jgi:hypothetical protein
MLQILYRDEARVGILSSHPFSISAFLRVFGSGIENLEAYQLEMTRKEARCVLSSCPIVRQNCEIAWEFVRRQMR